MIKSIKDIHIKNTVCSIKGTDEYVYCRWEREGSIYKCEIDIQT